MKNAAQRDIHVVRYFSSFVSVYHGKVILVTDPTLSSCPLASYFYKGLQGFDGADKSAIKREIANAIQSKIIEFGLFTAKRKLVNTGIAVAYGASEMLMFALRNDEIDAAVVVCDGAGTVITQNADIVQGIGARMNTVVLTSPIRETVAQLQRMGAQVVFKNALIDQCAGVACAIRLGYKKIAVTVSGHDAGSLSVIRRLAASNGVKVTILVVCTTGIPDEAVEQIKMFADIVWSCASFSVRRAIGDVAVLQISKQAPIFVLTSAGIDFVSAYANNATPIRQMDMQTQYLISNEPRGIPIRMGTVAGFLREEKLPVLSGKSFVLAEE